MGFLLELLVGLFLLSALVGLLVQGANSKILAPYIGLLLIAALIAGMGLLTGMVFHGGQEYFLIAAKGLAVLAGVLLCLHLMRLVGKKFFVSE